MWAMYERKDIGSVYIYLSRASCVRLYRRCWEYGCEVKASVRCLEVGT